MAVKKLTPLKHTESALEFLRGQTDSVILFYSGGKDSMILLDLLSKKGFKVHLVFMYLVDGLEHIEKYIDWAEKKYKVPSLRIQHWMVSHYFRDNYFRFHTETEAPLLKLGDIEEKAREHFGVEWILNGSKQSDSMNRGLHLRTLFLHSIEPKTKHCYALSSWKKADCLAYIKQNRLPTPVNYGMGTKSSGVDLNADVLNWLKVHYPEDLKKILKVFPLAETLIIDK